MTADPSRVDCEWVHEMAPDIALGLLTGQERGDALAHLERCESCRAEVAVLSGTVDEILLAAPAVAPPAGFDRRVLAAVAAQRASGDHGPDPAAPAPHRAPGRRRMVHVMALTAAAAVLAAVALVGLVGDSSGDRDATVAAEMRTGRGRAVGTVTLTGADPVEIAVDVPEWEALVERWEGEASGDYWLAVETRDGERTMRPAPDDGGDDEWTMTVDVGADDVAGVSVVDAEGRIWCSSTFPP